MSDTERAAADATTGTMDGLGARAASCDVVGFAGWAAVGASAAVCVITPLTISPWLAPAAIAGGVILLGQRAWRGRAVWGAGTGAGLFALVIAWLNREGPGTVCHVTATSQNCQQEWSPWPWLAAGVVLVAAGIALFAWLRRHHSRGFGRARQRRAA